MTSRADVAKNGAEEKETVLYSLAIEQAQFGSHKYIVLVICGLVYASVSAPGSSLLESRDLITCSLALDHDQQMKINLYIFLALISGSLLIAIPSDLASRLKPLIVSLICYGLATVGLGFCTEYYCFASLSVFRAFWASGLLTVTTVYVAEIQTPRYRGTSLCCLQIFWLIGLVATPVLSIPWRTSQFIFGTLALITSVLAARFLAESPRLLLTLGKHEAAIKSLRKIYRTNFRNRETEYPVKSLADDFSLNTQDPTKLRTYVPNAEHPPWYCSFVVLQIQFVFDLCYFTMSYWFREMSCRHVPIFPIMPREIECKLGEKYLPWLQQSTGTSDLSCNSYDIEADYYKEVSLVALATLPILIWMILRFDYQSRSYFTTLSHVLAGLLSFVVHFLIGTKYDLVYTCLIESTWIVSTTVSSCLVTEIFKTRYRVLAVGLANSLGYVGMAMGMYGLLLNGSGSCILVISLTGIFFTAKGVMAGSVATLAVLWMSLQGMGFVAQPSFIGASRLPITLHNYLASYTGLPPITYQSDIVVNSKLFIDSHLFPAIDQNAINSSVRFGQGIVNRLTRLETNIASAEIAFSNDTPTQGQYVHWFPTTDAHRLSIDALIGVKASIYLAQNNCQRFGLRNKKCAQFISTLKMEDTVIGERCANRLDINCDNSTLYRSIDGTCNNLDNPRWGSSMSAYSRILFPNYADGIQEPRHAERSGKRLPEPRHVSSTLSAHDQPNSESSKTLAVMQWAQFVDHDVSHTPVRKMVTNNKAISCCRSDGNFLSPRYVHPDCAPIAISEDDSVYGKERIRCMNYVRSMPALRPDCSFGPTEQMNQVSHYLDGSTIYGSTLKESRKLRTLQGGLLRVEVRNGVDYLPTADSEPTSLCNDKGCYNSGDFRVNFVPHLAAMHTIWHREHNRIARKLAELNPLWNDEIVYQETRRIVIAEIQHITYNEWLPVVLGTNQTRNGHLFPVNVNGVATFYNNHDNPSISNEAATAAFRFMNSLVQGKLRMHDEERQVTGTLHLHEHFSKARVIENGDVLDSLIRGLTTQSAQKMDIHMVADMTHKLHKTFGNLGMDSFSLDIQRGRDHGIPGYNNYRKYCGLPAASSFDDFLDTISPEIVSRLQRIYNHPNDIDLVVGGMAERSNPGSLLGPTFSCLISEQFSRLRRTDRFFYDSASQPHPFTGAQLNALRNVSLARVFCDNADNITSMQTHVFLKLQPGNELFSCDDYEAIPSVDLFAWAEKAKAYR